MNKPQACKGCPAEFNGGGFIPPDSLSESTRLVVWGEAGGREEEEQAKGFVGSSGRLLRGALWRGGISGESTAFTNVMLCRPPKNVFPGYVTGRECIKRHQSSSFIGHPWLATGANAIETLTGFRLKPLEVRGSILPVLGWGAQQWVTATIHPAFLVRGGGYSNPNEEQGKAQDELYPFLAIDAHRALQATACKIPNIHYATSEEVYAKFKQDKPEFIAIDIEGRKSHIELMGFCWGDDAWVVEGKDLTPSFVSEMLTAIPIAHNASFDFQELEGWGVSLPARWIDTINTSALLNPSVKLGLQAQVLTYVPGTCAWKGLVDHAKGVEARTPEVLTYEWLWVTILRRLGASVPETRREWFQFYNGLDVGNTFALFHEQRKELIAQKRWNYYTNIMLPLQHKLVVMGQRGLPVDPERMKVHHKATLRLERMAGNLLKTVGTHLFDEQLKEVEERIEFLQNQKSQEGRNFSGKRELTAAKTALRNIKKRILEGFNVDSYTQRNDLLYHWFGLPMTYSRKTKGPSTDEKAIESLLSRLQRETIKPKRGTREEASRLLRAMIAGKKWATWRRNYIEKALA